MRPNWRPTGSALAGWLLAAVFLFAGVEKTADPAAFAQAVTGYQLLPEFFIKLTALLVPAWEIAAGLALLVPRWRLAGACLAGALSLVFLGAVGSALVRGLDIECGCFGSAGGRAGGLTLLLDLGMLLASCLVILSV